MNQTCRFVVEMDMAPAFRAAMISSRSVISPPAMTGILLSVQIRRITLGISPGRTSMISGCTDSDCLRILSKAMESMAKNASR